MNWDTHEFGYEGVCSVEQCVYLTSSGEWDDVPCPRDSFEDYHEDSLFPCLVTSAIRCQPPLPFALFNCYLLDHAHTNPSYY
jgi:hypothetical protein